MKIHEKKPTHARRYRFCSAVLAVLTSKEIPLAFKLIKTRCKNVNVWTWVLPPGFILLKIGFVSWTKSSIWFNWRSRIFYWEGGVDGTMLEVSSFLRFINTNVAGGAYIISASGASLLLSFISCLFRLPTTLSPTRSKKSGTPFTPQRVTYNKKEYWGGVLISQTKEGKKNNAPFCIA